MFCETMSMRFSPGQLIRSHTSVDSFKESCWHTSSYNLKCHKLYDKVFVCVYLCVCNTNCRLNNISICSASLSQEKWKVDDFFLCTVTVNKALNGFYGKSLCAILTFVFLYSSFFFRCWLSLPCATCTTTFRDEVTLH